MALTIKNEETHRLVRELTELTGETQATAVTIAVRERLNRLRPTRVANFVDELRAIAKDIEPGVAERFRVADHGDVLYDEDGLPR